MKPNVRFRLRSMMVAILIVAMVLAYVASYVQLSRRGMREANEYGLDGFLYVPCAEASASEDLTRHWWLALFYSPANWADRQFFGGQGPVESIMWRLSG